LVRDIISVIASCATDSDDVQLEHDGGKQFRDDFVDFLKAVKLPILMS
jgi:hypothetical protein